MAVVIDDILAAELKSPGSDTRFGVNLIARPPTTLIKEIQRIQAVLKKLEPEQYYYPPDDLHLTFLEFGAEWPRDKAEHVFTQVLFDLSNVLLNIQPVTLKKPTLRPDDRTCVLNFLDGVNTVAALRNVLINTYKDKKIPVVPRSHSPSTHVTFMRYINPTHISKDQWEKAVSEAARALSGDWEINEVWLTCGATWYGMQSRIKKSGPFKLKPI